METAIDKEMYEYFRQLNDAEKKSAIEMLKTFLQGRKRENTYTTLEEYNKELEEAEEGYQRGEFISHEEMIKQIKKWLRICIKLFGQFVPKSSCKKYLNT